MIETSTILLQDITLVYDSLDLRTIDTNKLKGLMDVKPAPAIMDTPEAILVIYPSIHLIIQLGNSRIRMSLQKPGSKIGSTPLWKIAHKCHAIVSKSQLIAYGFNFDVGATISNSTPQEVINDQFISNPEMIEELTKGHLIGFLPRLKFRRNETLYDLILEPMDDQKIKSHLNVHFEENDLPSENEIDASFHEEYEYFVSILQKLFNRGNGN